MSNIARRTARSLRGGLAIIVVTTFVITLALLFTNEVPDKSREMVSMLVGAQIGYVKDILSYYFPSLTNPRTSGRPTDP